MPPKKFKLTNRKYTCQKSPKPIRNLPLNGPLQSDTFLATSLLGVFFLQDIDVQATGIDDELMDSDGFMANEFYVILDKPQQYNPEDNLEELVSHAKTRIFNNLRESCRQTGNNSDFLFLPSCKDIKYIQVYEGDECSEPCIKSCVTVTRNFEVRLSVHRKQIPSSHAIWKVIASSCYSADSLNVLLSELGQYTICRGNTDEQFQELKPELETGASVNAAEYNYNGYRENHFGSTIRSVHCDMIVSGQYRRTKCHHCKVYRRTLSKTVSRRQIQPQIATHEKNWLKTRTRNEHLTKSQSLEKLKQLKSYSLSLEQEVSKLKSELKQKKREYECAVMTSLIDANEAEIAEDRSDETSDQRLFLEQQRRWANLQNKRAMKWHPSIIKWCLDLKSKSSKAYAALRNSGFIHLPSKRTLYSYENLTRKGARVQVDVVDTVQDSTLTGSQLPEASGFAVGNPVVVCQESHQEHEFFQPY